MTYKDPSNAVNLWNLLIVSTQRSQGHKQCKMGRLDAAHSESELHAGRCSGFSSPATLAGEALASLLILLLLVLMNSAADDPLWAPACAGGKSHGLPGVALPKRSAKEASGPTPGSPIRAQSVEKPTYTSRKADICTPEWSMGSPIAQSGPAPPGALAEAGLKEENPNLFPPMEGSQRNGGPSSRPLPFLCHLPSSAASFV